MDNYKESLNQCPRCGGIADNGHDRCLPPSPYFCTKCANEIERANGGQSEIRLIADDKLDDLWREACRDDWHLRIVCSEVRGLISEIKRLRTTEPVSVSLEGLFNAFQNADGPIRMKFKKALDAAKVKYVN